MNLNLILGAINADEREYSAGPRPGSINLAAKQNRIVELAGKDFFEVQHSGPSRIRNGEFLDRLAERYLEVSGDPRYILLAEPYRVTSSAAGSASLTDEKDMACYPVVVDHRVHRKSPV